MKIPPVLILKAVDFHWSCVPSCYHQLLSAIFQSDQATAVSITAFLHWRQFCPAVLNEIIHVKLVLQMFVESQYIVLLVWGSSNTVRKKTSEMKSYICCSGIFRRPSAYQDMWSIQFDHAVLSHFRWQSWPSFEKSTLIYFRWRNWHIHRISTWKFECVICTTLHLKFRVQKQILWSSLSGYNLWKFLIISVF